VSAQRRRWAGIAAALLLLMLGVAGVQGTLAAFTATTSNPGNSFQAASDFDGYLRMASGSYTGNGTDNRAISAGFQPNLVIVKGDNTQNAVARTSTMTGDAAKPLVGATNLTANLVQSLSATGFTIGTDARVNTNGTTYHWTAVKASGGAFRVGSYTGNGGASQSISGLGFQPEYVAVLGAVADDAVQRYVGMTRAFQFNADTGTTTRITSLAADGFTVGNSAEVNTNGATYHYVAFNDVANTIEADSYTGTGGDDRNFTLVGFEPGYVMIRSGDTATARRGHHRMASMSGDDTHYFDNFASATNRIQALLANGFQLGTDTAVNANAVGYHYLALANTAGGCSVVGSQTVTAGADAWIDQAAPSSNLGADSVLKVTTKGPNLNTRALVQFNLPSLPAGCSVTTATLRMHNKSPVSGRTLAAYANSAAWTENGVTWANQPGTTGSASTAATPSSAGWMQWDVTSQVQGMYSGSNNGFSVRDQTENGPGVEQQFDSREAGINLPELVVTFG
jgi:predicted ribosomally synthesized peptide with SipW-like signal peptide